jgi:hypothetical protein
MNWWFGLTILEHILFAIALASTIVVLVKTILTIAKFYQVDKLNSEPEELENYESVANNDSDIEKHVPGFFSVMSINVFLASGCWSFFVFELFMPQVWAALTAFLFGALVLLTYGIVDHLIKKNRNKQNKSTQNN